MSHQIVSQVQDSTSTTGTGAITTLGAFIGYQPLSAVGSVGDTFDYSMRLRGGTEWEEGVATIISPTSFSRAPSVSSNGGQLVNFSAGIKDVLLTVTAFRLKKLNNGTSSKVLYLSNYCKSDTDLSPYAQLAGVDQRALAQAVFDLGKNNPGLRVVGDVKITAANVPGTDDTFLLHPNTVVLWLPGCGVLQAAGSKGAMWGNANPTTNANNNAAAITDERIGIIGGIFHGNREGQTVKMDVFRFSGVRNLYTALYTIYRASGMGVRVINPDGWTNKDYLIDQGKDILTAPNDISINTDGVHVHGPANNIRDTNGRIMNCGDDSYALNADDAWKAGTYLGRFDNVYGPITDVIVTSLHFEARYFGVRILSGNSRVHNVFFMNTTGSTSGSAFRTDNYLDPAKTLAAGPGNCGLIVVDGWNVETDMVDFSWGQMGMTFDCRIEQLKLKNLVKRKFNNGYFPAVRISEKANIDDLEIDFMSRNYNGGTAQGDQVDICAGAVVDKADIRMRTRAGSPVAGYPLRVRAGATVNQMALRGDGTNFTATMLKEGYIGVLNDTSTMTTALAVPSTFTFQGGTGASTGFNQDTSNANAFSYTGPVSGVVRSFKKNTLDGLSGNVRYAPGFTVRGAVNPNLHVAIAARAVGMIPWSALQSGYYLDFQFNNSGTSTAVTLHRVAGGTSSQAGTDTPLWSHTSVLTAGRYVPSLVINGAVVSFQVQRSADGFWMQPDGSWASAVATVATVTDSAPLPAVSGEWGGYVFSDGAGAVDFDNVTIVAA